MKKLIYISLTIAVLISTYILYVEATSHKHFELVSHGEEEGSGFEDLAFLEEIMSHDEGEVFELPPPPAVDVEQATDFVHALADLSVAVSPFLGPLVLYYVHTRKKVPFEEEIA